MILPNQVMEARNLDGRIRLARKERLPDAGDLPLATGRLPPPVISREAQRTALINGRTVKLRDERMPYAICVEGCKGPQR